ncbi:MAG: CHAT domain-containing protein [Streptomycetaceae bacterium]|nr:CHAT domain-containing protein [Streptomycetaceae bacterium]
MEPRPPWYGLPVDALEQFAIAARLRGHRLGTTADLTAAIEVFTHLVRTKDPSTDPARALLMASALIETHIELGKLTGDTAHLDTAVALAEEFSGRGAADPAARHMLRGVLALALRNRFDVRRTEADLKRSLEITEELLLAPDARRDPAQRRALVNQAANNHMSRFLLHGRIEDLDRAVELRREAVKALGEGNTGGGDTGDGNTDDGDIDKGEAAAGLRHNLAQSLLNRHHLRGDDRDLAEALEALRIAVERTPPRSPDAPAFRLSLGQGLLALARVRGQEDGENAGGSAAAASLLDQAIELVGSDLPPHQARSVLGRLRLQSLSEALLLRYAAVRDLADLDRAIAEIESARSGPATPAPDVAVLVRLAEASRLRHDARGDPYDLQRGIAAYEESLKQEPPSVDAAQDADNWGIWAMDRGSWDEAARAYSHALRALRDRYEQQNSALHKQEWLGRSLSVPDRAAYALVRSGRPKRAAAAAEQGRALQLAEILQRETADLDALRQDGRADLGARFEAARDELAALRAIPEADADSEARATRALSAAIEEIRAAGYKDFLGLPGTAPVRDAAGEATVVHLFASTHGGAAALVPPGPAPITSVLLDGADLATLTEKVNTHLVRLADRGDSLAWEQHLDDLTRWCWTHVMDPVLSALPPGRPCVLVPSGALSFLPLHAAWEPDTDRPTGRRYALDVLRLSYAPSATALRAVTKRAADRGVTAGAGTESGVGTGSLPFPALGVHDPVDGQPPLPFASLEIDAMRAVLPEASDRLSGREATTDAVLARLPRTRLVHFACHGTARLDDPLSSGLFLTGGPLTVREVIRHRGATARLAVLSGCETALVGTALPDEAVGLPAGSMQAGFAAVIASLWAVDDIATALLMTRFYQLCHDDSLAPPEALRRAQRWLRDATNDEKAAVFPSYGALAEGRSPLARRMWGTARAHASPRFWAAFTYTGAVSP